MKILVVEDEHRIAQSIKKGLEQERFTVDLSYDGEDGLALAGEGTYDVLLVDIMLPKMDGISVVRSLRHQQIHTPILLLTAKSQLDDKVKGLDSGADDYLTKPFAFEELLARIRALVRRPKEVVEEELAVRNLRINPSTFQVFRDEKEIVLSHKEFALAEYLVRHAKRVVTKDQIISHVWDWESNILPNTIEVYIRNLRKKIDEPWGKSDPYIHTVRGFGYKIE